MAFGTTPLSTTTLGSNQFPVSGVYVQGTSGGNITALQGGPVSSADGSGNVSAPAAVYVPDGNDITQGTSTDAANANTIIGQLKQIKSNTASVVIGSGTVSASQNGTWTMQPGNTANTTPWLMTINQGGNSATVTGANALKVDGSGVTQPISGTVTVNALPAGSNTIGSVKLIDSGGSNVASISASGALKVDNSAVTQPISGSVTANIGTTNGLSLDATTAKLNVAQGAALGSNTGPMMQGSVTTAAPSYTTGNVNPLSLTTSGALRTDSSATTQPVSGTVSASQSGTWTMQPGNTANTTPWLASINQGGNTATVANLTNSKALAVEVVDASGNQVTSFGGSNASVNSTGSAVPASGTYLAGNQSGNLTGLALDGSGNLKVNVAAGGGSGGTSSSYGSAFPSTGTAIGASDGTNMQGLLVESSSNKNLRVSLYGGATQATVTGSNALKVDGSAVTQPVSGTVTANAGSGTFNVQQSNNTADYDTGAGTQTMTMFGVALPASGGAVAGGTTTNPIRVDVTGSTTQPVSGTVTANIGTTNGLALDTSVNGILVSQGSTTSGEKGPLIQAAVTTAAPTYTTAQTSPLSLTTAGALRTDSSAVTQPVSGTVTVQQSTASNLKVDLSGTAANATAIKVDGSAVTQPVSGTVTANAGSGTFAENLTQIAGSSISTAATGVQKVGLVGNTGATVDSTVAAGTAPTNALVMGSVFNSTPPAPTTGQAMAVQADQSGNARMFPGIALASLSAWNSGSSLNATQNIYTNSGCPAVLVQLVQTTTLTAGAITFEVTFDGTNWITAPTGSVMDPTSATFAQISLPYTVQASTNKAFIISGSGWQGLRIKLSTQITGSGSVTPSYALLAYDPAETVIALSPTAANFNVTASQSGAWTAVPNAATSGGSTPSHTVSAASTNATSVKGSAGQLYGVTVSNTNASARFFKLYDKSSSPTVGTDTPISTIQIPGSATVIRAYPVGLAFTSGIAFAATTGVANSDTGAVGANDLVIDLDYK